MSREQAPGKHGEWRRIEERIREGFRKILITIPDV